MPILEYFWNNSEIGYSILKIDNFRIAIMELFRNWLIWNYSEITILDTVVWHGDVGFSKKSIFWLIWVLSTSKRTSKEKLSTFQKKLSKKFDF
jgi:hypothetical protein